MAAAFISIGSPFLTSRIDPSTPRSPLTCTGVPRFPIPTPTLLHVPDCPPPAHTPAYRSASACSEARAPSGGCGGGVGRAALALHAPPPQLRGAQSAALLPPFRLFGPKLSWWKRGRQETGRDDERGRHAGPGRGWWSWKDRGPDVPAAAAGARRGCGTEGPWRAARESGRVRPGWARLESSRTSANSQVLGGSGRH